MGITVVGHLSKYLNNCWKNILGKFPNGKDEYTRSRTDQAVSQESIGSFYTSSEILLMNLCGLFQGGRLLGLSPVKYLFWT